VKPKRRCGAVAISCVAYFAFVASVCAQEATPPRHIGVPHDWSEHHILFSRDTLALHPGLMDREPRVRNQAIERWQAPKASFIGPVDPLRTFPEASGRHRDWSVTGLPARLLENNYPAKFSFDPDAPPSCPNDYVVFGLPLPGTTGGNANLIAFNNLYGPDGFCTTGTVPNVLFAYNTTTAAGGKIATSPILSLDGTKVAFVESIPETMTTDGAAIFHVLTWTAGQGTPSAAAMPTSMTSLPFDLTADDTASSPWIDYDTDTVYVGADDGNVYQITNVFNGTPTLSSSPWPRPTAPQHLTPPVLDSNLGELMVGNENGNLYQINIKSGAVATIPIGAGGDFGHEILAAPIVDVTNGTTFAVSGNDGTSAVLVEVNTATMAPMAKARIGQGDVDGVMGTSTLIPFYEPAFSNDYFNNPATGVVTLCGTGRADTTPWQYTFKFTGDTMKMFPSSKQQLATTGHCSGWTEFFNPNIDGGTDFFFFGLTEDCTLLGTSHSTTGCVVALSNNSLIPTASATVPGGTSGIVIDNDSTEGQASSIYFTAGSQDNAYKFTQDGLQ
jgi:hypothetical protein